SDRDFSAVRHVDSNGFGNAWPWPERAEIVTLGDSLTFGWGVSDSETWPAILSRALPENRVLNLGISGAGPQQYLRIYETFGIKLHPKVVLVGMFVRNDFRDAELFDRWLKSGAGGNYIVWRELGRPGSSLSLRRIVTKSYVGNLLL